MTITKFQPLDIIISNWVKKTPHKIAIQFNEINMSYSQLDARANGIANFINDFIPGVQHKILLFGECSPDFIAAMLACLKTGNIFIPLDPSLPIQRMKVLIDEINPDAMVVNNLQYKTLVTLLGVNSKKRLILIDDNKVENPLVNTHQYRYELDSINLCFAPRFEKNAYIFFTSGSTGKPKGVLGRHRSLAHFIDWEISQLHIDNTVKVSQLTNVSFDPFLRDVFVPLIAGGTCCLIPKEIRIDASALINLIDNQKITLMHMVPTLFKNLVSTISANKSDHKNILTTVEYILLAGELLHGADLKDFYHLLGERIQLVNLYGPTETTLAKFYYRIRSNDVTKSIIPIGKPISGADGLILNEQGQICSKGEKGILYIRTPYISSGYFNNITETAASFMLNPFNNNPNDLIYRTGDIARLLDDGNTEILGRIDFQVKVRGNRVELGEIENQLLHYEGISAAVVTIRKEENNQECLCAYFVSSTSITISLLKAYLAKNLSDYMIPRLFVQIEKMPLNVNGKIDRASLPNPSICNNQVVLGPNNITEKKLLAIWAGVLECEDITISIDDNFFEIGGHSLKAILAISRINNEFQTIVSIQEFFSHPKINELANLIQNKKKTANKVKINKNEKIINYPLSSSQRGIYIAQQISPNTPQFNISHAFKISGEIDVNSFKKSLHDLVTRHHSLRSHIINIDGNAIHHLVKPYISFNYADCYSCATNIESLLTKSANQPFRLNQETAIRFQLIKVRSNQYIFQLTVHHIAADAWSLNILLSDLWHCYQLNTQQINDVLPQVKLQYCDYAIWTNTDEAGNYYKTHKQYWFEQLENYSNAIDLETDFTRGSEPDYRGENIDADINLALCESIQHISQQHGATLFMTLLSTCYILLYKYTGAEDMIIGTPAAARSFESLESIVGTFVNLLPMRAQLSSATTFSDLLHAVKQTTMQVYEHQDYPYEQIIKDSNIVRNANRGKLFDIVFSMQNTKNEKLLSDMTFNMGNLKIEKYPVKNKYSKFDLTITITQHSSGMRINFNYATSLFEKYRIEQMCKHFIFLLQQISLHPHITMADIQLLTKKEIQYLIDNQNRPHVDFPNDKTIHGIFEVVVKNNPHHIAIKMGEIKLTYAELNRRANSLANDLIKKGISKKSIIAILLDRSPDQMIAILAILKTGNAYLPLDPDHPDERLKWILQDSQACLLITHSELSGKINGSQIPIIYLNHFQYHDTAMRNPTVEIQSEDIAYVIYTSGTTGKPKGVLVKHSNVIQLFFHQPNFFLFTNNDIWVMFHTYCFDFSVWEMFGALLFGGKLILLSKMTTRDPALFLQILKDEKVTILNQTPTAFYNLIEESVTNRSNDLSLRYVIFGGETLQPTKLRKWKKKYHDTKLINMFGITETTIHVTFKEITDFEIQNNISNIGKPIATYKCYVVDKDNNLLPPGIPGELLVGGYGVTAGYLNRNELTAQRFIPNKFCKGEILYRSGDLVKYRKNGEMQYLGRIDHQIQLYGFRIELNEIEQVLLSHPSVLDVRVLFSESIELGKYICAYVVCADNIDTFTLRYYVSTVLPSYMIPSYFIKIDQFPMTINGKVDIKLLPQPNIISYKKEEKILPRNVTERMIVKIWQQALGISGISIKDNFFDLGGDSLKAVKAVSLSKRKFSLIDLFKYPVVEDLVRHIKTSLDKNYFSLLNQLSNNSHSLALICVPYGGGDAADFQALAEQIEKMNKKISVLSVVLPGYDFSRGNSNFTSIQKMAKRIIKQIKQAGYQKIILYGHCVGSALAIALGREIEKNTSLSLLATFVGAVFPPDFGEMKEIILDPWADASDADIMESLRNLGWKNTQSNEYVISTIIKNFRHDVKGFRRYFYTHKNAPKLKAPLYFLVGSNDSSTHDFTIRAKEWEVFSEQLQTVIIENGDHYFIKSMPKQVAQIINNVITDQLDDGLQNL